MDYHQSYMQAIRAEVQQLAKIAEAARSKGLDPTSEVEIRPADDVAGRVEGLVGPPGVAEQIRELSETKPAHSVAFEVARNIIHTAQVNGEDLEAAAEQAIRTALAILTEGITAGPIEGIAGAKIKTNTDGSRYLAVYFAGPIRAAGGTEAAQTVIVADAVRQQIDLDRYKPSNENIERYVEEVDLYNRISHLQYPSRPEEVRLAARNIPVEVTGEPTAQIEVTGYRDPPGVETNRLRGGAILVLNDSILGKAHKLANQVAQLSLSGWDWLENLTPQETDENQIEKRIQPKEKYLEDIIAGRPVLAYPSRKGGFRVRYGRSRNTGLAALGVHPATMVLLDSFIACGTQLIIERPGKGCIAMPVDTIHGPIIKTHSGSIHRVDTVEEAKKLCDSVSKILFLGDLLIAFGEFRENNHLLVPAGYCPEWWAQEVLNNFLEAPSKIRQQLYTHIPKTEFYQLVSDPLLNYPDPWQAINISMVLNAPLHPRYLYFWEDLSIHQLKVLSNWVQELTPTFDNDKIKSLSGSLDNEIEEILNTLCIPCKIQQGQIWFFEAAPILYALFIGSNRCTFPNSPSDDSDALDHLQDNWSIPLRPKGTFYIGARIGRPEKAKRREMSPPPHGIYPVGNAGGPMRDIRKAEKTRAITVDINHRLCSRCGELTFLQKCPTCHIETHQTYWCPNCNSSSRVQKCGKCGATTNTYGPVDLDVKSELQRIHTKLGGILPKRIKGVKGLMSKDKTPELLEKAVLRAAHDLFVYKDGTIRYDMTDAPLTHFKPCEINVPIDKLRKLGYNFDKLGAPLQSTSQILELKIQDIIVPYDCAKYLYRVSQYVDALLTQVYDLDPFYNLQTPEDLVGHLVIGLAPHTSAGIIGRIVGFTPLRVCYAHPFWHAAKRRNCLHENEEILIWDTDKHQILREPIGQVVEDLLQNGANHRVVDDYGTIEIENSHSNWLALSFDPELLKPIFQPIKHWVKGTSNKWITITTQSGRKITMTPEHTVITWNQRTKTTERKTALQLEQGDLIPIINRSGFPIIDSASFFNILQELSSNLPKTQKFEAFKHATRLRKASKWLKKQLFKFVLSNLCYHSINKSKDTPSAWQLARKLKLYFQDKLPTKPYKHIFSTNWYHSIPLSHLEVFENEGVFQWNDIPDYVEIGMARDDKTFAPYIANTAELYRLLGYFISEGYIRDESTCYQTNFSVPNPEIRKHLIQLIQKILGSQPYYKKDNHQLCHTSRIHAYLFAYAWKLGTKALQKRLPTFIFTANKDHRYHFLSALIDGDGSIIPQACRTTIYTGNQSLAEDYCLLLSTFGIFARISSTKGGRFGQKILNRYEELGTQPKETKGLYHVNIPGRENLAFLRNLSLIHKKKTARIEKLFQNGFPKTQRIMRISNSMIADKIKSIKYSNQFGASYCLEINPINPNVPAYHNITQNTLMCVGQCDGDEDSLLLALDSLINFSRAYLPTSRGGSMDTPLVLSITITPKEIDDEAHHIDGSGLYPLEFYERARQFVDPKDVEDIFDLVAHRIVDHRLDPSTEVYGLDFSHPTGDVNYGPRITTYSKLKTMQEKVERQLGLGERIAAVDVQDMARRLLDSHFLPDIFGNIRAFSTQQVRCTRCNQKYRRIPLSGKCTECSGNLVLTVTQAGITKYVELASKVIEHYQLPLYYQQRLEMAKRVIKSLFPMEEDEQQTTLREFTPTRS
ncbi:MAG: DNA polymerase II large subunit [Promethearchaeota archaeon]